MVVINFTLFVELILFLLFLWGTNVFILRPVLRSLDDREELVQHNEEQTEADTEEANQIDKEFAVAMAGVRREADEAFRDARRGAIDTQIRTLESERAKSNDAVSKARDEAVAQAESQRGDAERLAPELVESIASQLGMGGNR